jgi:hypothetical protein
VQAQLIGTERAELPGQTDIQGKWDLSLETEASKSLAEYTDWSGYVSAEVGRSYKKFDISGQLAYSYLFDDQVTVSEDTRYGLEDLEFLGVYQDVLAHPLRSLKPFVGATLPTSEVSQNASLMGTLSGGVSYSQQESYFNWGTRHTVLASAYQYETANAFGTSYNSPLGVSNSLSLWRGFKRLTLATSYSLYTYYNFASHVKNLQTYRASVAWAFDKNWSATVFYRWQDQVVSYLSAFNDDTSKAGVFLTYTK